MPPEPTRRFIDTVVLITSASIRTGAAVARGFEREGATVILAVRGQPPGESLAEELRAEGGSIELVPTDVADPTALQHLLARTLEVGGKLDVLVNDTSLPDRVQLDGPVTPERLTRLVQESLDVPIALSRRALPHLAGVGGQIVNLAAPIGPGPMASEVLDAAIRAGLLAFSRTLAEQLSETKVRVSMISPGGSSPTLDPLAQQVLDSTATTSAQRIPEGRERSSPQRWHASVVRAFSHDVNTPLGVTRTAGSSISDMVGELLDDPPADPDDLEELRSDLRNALDLLDRNLDRAQDVIMAFKRLVLLHLSSEHAAVRLERLVEERVAAVRPELLRAEIRVQIDRREGTDYTWDGPPDYLGQVITELLHNAIRHAFVGRDGGQITIDFGREDAEDVRVIRIADDGNGMDPTLLSRISESMRDTARGGLRLGLARARFIVVRLLGGTLECESAEGEGTTFTITLRTSSASS